MTTTIPPWAYAHPYATAGIAAVLLLLAVAAVWGASRAVRSAVRPQASVVVAAIAAAACTAYSADTSWRFARDQLGMTDTAERAAMFAAAEIALFSCGLMARANLSATSTETTTGKAGVPGVLVWVITGVQVIPAYAESGLIGGTVRAFVGPVLAALLWHQAMGLEIRVRAPRALSSGLLSTIGRELRERLLSRLGLAVRDRSAEQISRDRATARAVRLAARPNLRAWGQARLAAAVARASVGIDPHQRGQLLQLLAARRSAAALRTIELVSPWDPPQPPAAPRTLPALVHQQLTHMDPVDAVRTVQAANPAASPAEVASLCVERGLVVTETQVRIATGAHRTPHPVRPSAAAPAPAPEPQVHPHPEPAPEVQPTPGGPAAPEPEDGLLLDVDTLHAYPHPEVCAPVTVLDEHRRTRTPSAPAPEPPADDAALLERARTLPPGPKGVPSLRTLKSELRIGQAVAQRLQTALAS